MKTTIVPAQITTVEDKVAGNLSFTQLMLLVVPVFVGGAVFTFMPPFMGITALKTVIFAGVALLFLTLAIRIKGRLVLEWIVVLTRYNQRPRFVVYNKNDAHLRSSYDVSIEEAEELVDESTEAPEMKSLHLGVDQLLRYESALNDPKKDIRFETTKKGGLRVSIKQVE